METVCKQKTVLLLNKVPHRPGRHHSVQTGCLSGSVIIAYSMGICPNVLIFKNGNAT